MRHLFFFIAGFTLLFASCDDSQTITVNTDLEKEMAIAVSETDTVPFKSDKQTYFYFKQTDTVKFEDNADLLDNQDLLESIMFKKVKCKLNGLGKKDTIKELKIAMLDPYVSIAIVDLTEADSLSFDLEFDLDSLQMAADKFFSNQEMAIELTGKSTYAPLKFNSKLIFNTDAECKVKKE